MANENLIIQHDEANQKYDAMLPDGTLVGLLVYEYSGHRMVLTHAAIQDDWRHRGFGYQLISTVLNDVRGRGEQVTIICPVVRDFVDRHPEYSDVVDPAHPGIESRNVS
jgi:predicted GNAT family acetyltransferase